MRYISLCRVQYDCYIISQQLILKHLKYISLNCSITSASIKDLTVSYHLQNRQMLYNHIHIYTSSIT